MTLTDVLIAHLMEDRASDSKVMSSISVEARFFFQCHNSVSIYHMFMSSISICSQQLKREKTVKDDLLKELESKEVEMHFLLQRQQAVSDLVLAYVIFNLIVVSIKFQCLTR